MKTSFRLSNIEQHVPVGGSGLYEIHTTTGIPLKVGISTNLRERLIQHRASRQSGLKLKAGGTWDNPADVKSKNSVLAHHLYYDAQIAPSFELTSESGRRDFLETCCVIVIELTDSLDAARTLEKSRELSGVFRYVGPVMIRPKDGGMPDTLTPRLYDALSYTFQLFGRDSRKGSSVPVMAHLLSVCALVQQDGGSEDEAIAGLLHDALEDKPSETSEEEIRRRFGEGVARMVRIATDTPREWVGGPKPDWKLRKQGYIDRVATEAPTLLRPTVADKIDNLRAILAEQQWVGNEFWARFKAGKEEQLWYYSACYQAYEKAGASPGLLRQLKVLVKELASAVRE
jgi:hypothetical protein